MANNIQVNTGTLTGAAQAAKDAGNSLNTSLESWSSQGESSIALAAFAEQYLLLEKAMALYQQLLTKDLIATQAAAAEFQASDSDLAQIWK